MSKIIRPLMWNEYPEFVDYLAPNLVMADYPPVVGDANIPADFDLFGKFVGDLQYGVKVYKNKITGTLKYVEDYSGWAAGASGNFIALHFYTPGATSTTVELVGGQVGPVQLDSDMIAVLHISDLETTSEIEVITTNGTDTTTVKYDISELVLEDAE